jgi:hypothetical protein
MACGIVRSSQHDLRTPKALVSGIRRRDFVILLGGAAAWPLAAHAEQTRAADASPRIAFLTLGLQENYPAFVDGLRRLGYAQGRNLDIDYRHGPVDPDVLIQAHSASMGMIIYDGDQFPSDYSGDAFAAQHGSWNRGKRTGYKVIRARLKDGMPTGEYEDFMTGFVVDGSSVWARPVGVAVAHDGAPPRQRGRKRQGSRY